MAIFDVDVGGATYEVDAPDEKTAWKWANSTHTKSQPAKPEYVTGHNAVMGSLASAADIGATLLRPVDAVLNATGITDKTNAERRKQLGEFFQQNADPESLEFKGAGLVTDIAGTAGVGGLLGKVAKVAGAAPKVVAALESGGFNLGGSKALTGGGNLADAALRAGAGFAGGAASAGLTNPDDALKGGIIGAVLPGGVQLAGAAGAGVRNVMRGGAERLMQSALKPTIEQLKSGDAKIAIQTLLDMGISPTMAGVNKMRSAIDDINLQIDDLIKGSDAKIDRQKVISALTGVRSKFSNQVAPQSDLAAIQGVADDFAAHPKLANLNAKELELVAEIKRASDARVSALQDAGRFDTMAAQQRTLSQSQPINLGTRQPTNEPYFNVGSLGGDAVSPLAPSRTGGTVMPPPRYTPNLQRVPEAQSAANEARQIAMQRAAEKAAAENALAEHIAAGGSGIPVELAQEMKKGTYRVLKGKYGEAGSASTEAQKALARRLKEGVAEAVPAVAGLNAKESALLKTLDVAERRALMDANKNTMGLAALAGNPASWAAFMADRSAAFKALAARMANKSANAAPSTVKTLDKLLEKPAVRSLLIQSNQTSQ